MTFVARSRLALPSFSSALLLLAACGDGRTGGSGDTETTTGMTGVSQTQGATTLDPTDTDGSTTDDSDTVDPSDGSTGGDLGCQTVQCGPECCADGQECVLDECRDACDSGVRCGEDLTTCCGEGQVCIDATCLSPGDDCVDSFDCPLGEFCEPTIGQCLPQADDVACEVLPDFQQVEVELEWSAEEQQIESTPFVADIDGDNLPEVVVTTFKHDDNGDGEQGFEYTNGIVQVFAGETGQLQFEILENPLAGQFGSHGYATAGLADVDGNDLPDIIYAGRATNSRSLVHAVSGTGNLLWTSHRNGLPYDMWIRNGAPTFANLDDDDESEIIWGGLIMDNDGLVVWDGGETIDTPEGMGAGLGPLLGSNVNEANGNVRRGYGGVAAAADLTGDGYPEIITGRYAFSVNWTQGFPNPNVVVTELWDAGAPDGWPAVGDIDMDGDPEVVLVGDGILRVLNGNNGTLWAPQITLPGDGINPVGRGGPPTIADFDGDGRPEVATAAATRYAVFDFARPGEDIVQPGGDPPPSPGDVFVRWAAVTQDISSNGTASSVFDFQGDGRAEVMYGDECYFRIYDGSDGSVIFQTESSSVTAREYPVVVDVDADGNSELLVVANDNSVAAHCSGIQGYTGRRGLFVYGDPNDQWVRTRRVWPSHTYHVTDSDSRGNTPPMYTDNWTEDGLNNFRQNVQGAGVFNAPDLSVDVAVGFSTCLDQEFQIVATVRNEGNLGVPAGIIVNLYEGTDATGTLIGPAMTDQSLLPGQFTTVTWAVDAPGGQPKDFFVAVDGADDDTSAITECNEDNNTAATVTVACPNQG